MAAITVLNEDGPNLVFKELGAFLGVFRRAGHSGSEDYVLGSSAHLFGAPTEDDTTNGNRQSGDNMAGMEKAGRKIDSLLNQVAMCEEEMKRMQAEHEEEVESLRQELAAERERNHVEQHDTPMTVESRWTVV